LLENAAVLNTLDDGVMCGLIVSKNLCCSAFRETPWHQAAVEEELRTILEPEADPEGTELMTHE
jgi:hypothetical protein